MSKIKEAIDRIKVIVDSLDEDDPDRMDMLDTEADYSALMEWAMVKRNDTLALAQSTKELSDAYKVRQKRLEKRADTFKDICGILMNAANESSYAGVAGTASIRQNPDKIEIVDEDKLPKQYIKTSTSPDKTAINKTIKAGEHIDGVQVSDGGTSVTIRVK